MRKIDEQEVDIRNPYRGTLSWYRRCHRSHPVAKLVAFEEGAPQFFGHLAGSVTIHGDVVGPVEVEWNVAS